LARGMRHGFHHHHGFHHVTVRPDQRRYLAVTHPVTGKLYRWVVLPFGTSSSPAIFWDVVLEAGKIFRSELAKAGLGNVRLWEYCDDLVVAAPNASDMQAAFGVLDRVADELGVEWKKSKDEGANGDLQELEVWGLLLKTGLKGATLTIPEDKRARYGQNLEKVLRDLRTQGKADFGESRSLVGQLAFCCRATRWGRGYMDELWDGMVAADAGGGAALVATMGILEEIVWWEKGKWGRARLGKEELRRRRQPRHPQPTKAQGLESSRK